MCEFLGLIPKSKLAICETNLSKCQADLDVCQRERAGLVAKANDLLEQNNVLADRIRKLNIKVTDLTQQLEFAYEELNRYLPTVDVETVHLLDGKAIREWFRTKYPGCVTIALDDTIFSADVNTTLKIIKEDWTDELEYIAEQWDCEDYAWHVRMMIMRKYGLNHIGVLYSYTHGFNFVVFPNFPEEGSIKWLEPQTDGVFRPMEGLFEEYKVRYVQI